MHCVEKEQCLTQVLDVNGCRNLNDVCVGPDKKAGV